MSDAPLIKASQQAEGEAKGYGAVSHLADGRSTTPEHHVVASSGYGQVVHPSDRAIVWKAAASAVAAATVAAAGFGLWWWRPRPSAHTYASGWDLAGLLVLEATFAPAVGLVIAAASAFAATRSPGMPFVIAALLLTTLGAVAAVQASHSGWLGCGLLWCTDPAPQPHMNTAAAEGSREALTFTAIIVFFGVAAALIWAVSSSRADASSPPRVMPTATRAAVWTWVAALIAVATVLAVGALGSRLPVDARDLDPQAIATAAHSSDAAASQEVKQSYTKSFSMPAGGGVWWTWTPPRVAFIAALCAFIICGAVASTSSVIRQWLRARMYLPGTNVSFTGASIVSGLILKTFGAITLAYWWLDADYGPIPPSFEVRVGRVSGHLATTTMALLLFPVNRLPLVHRLAGTSRTTVLHYHAILGYLMLALIGAHVVGFAWGKHQSIVVWFVSMLSATEWHEANMAWVVMLFVVPGMLVAPFVRERTFEAFRALHLVAAYALIPAVLWHAYRSWDLLLPALIALAADRFTRLVSSARCCQEATITAVGNGYVRVDVRDASVQFRPGQHAYLNVPAISLLEWHPFSVSSSSYQGAVAFHVKAMGPGSWTRRLYDAARANAPLGSGNQVDEPATAGATVRLFLEGPYGGESAFFEDPYDAVVLVAGGIGITPCSSILADMLQQAAHNTTMQTARKITLVWVCKNPRALSESLGLPAATGPAAWMLSEGAASYSCVLHETGPHATGASRAGKEGLDAFSTSTQHWAALAHAKGWYVAAGRPDWDSLMSEAIPLGCQRPLLVTCGPESLCADAERAAVDRNNYVAIHRESFAK